MALKCQYRVFCGKAAFGRPRYSKPREAAFGILKRAPEVAWGGAQVEGSRPRVPLPLREPVGIPIPRELDPGSQ